jgi:hypothetical protein
MDIRENTVTAEQRGSLVGKVPQKTFRCDAVKRSTDVGGVSIRKKNYLLFHPKKKDYSGVSSGISVLVLGSCFYWSRRPTKEKIKVSLKEAEFDDSALSRLPLSEEVIEESTSVLPKSGTTFTQAITCITLIENLTVHWCLGKASCVSEPIAKRDLALSSANTPRFMEQQDE